MNKIRNRDRMLECLPDWPAPVRRNRLRRIWLVDDDDILRDLLEGLIWKTNLLVPRGFASGELLLSALAREGSPETILLDVHLRDRNGIEFIQPIKALAPNCPVLMLTTFFDPESAARALQAGAERLLTKSEPFDFIVSQILAVQAPI